MTLNPITLTKNPGACAARRCGGVAWGDDGLALLYELRHKTQTITRKPWCCTWKVRRGGLGRRRAGAAVRVAPQDKLKTPKNPGGSDLNIGAHACYRCGGVAWGDDGLALLYESWYKTRRSVVWAFAPGGSPDAKRVLFDRNYEDAYTDPGCARQGRDL